MNNNTLSQLRKVSPMKLIFGTILFAFGIFAALPNPFFLIFSGFGVFLLLREGSDIDLASKKYREFYSVLGVKFGTWKNLPDIEYVSVFKTNENKRVQSLAASANFSNEVYLLNLFYNTNRKIEAYRTENIQDAFENAKYLSEVLNIDILDATEREAKWL